jgi:G3E family GTPase
MSELNIDALLVANGEAQLSRTEEKLVEMSNGCICCTLREDLLIEIKRLAEMGRFDYLVIESTGVSEPLPVAETFTFDDEGGASLSDIARLDTMVTVVDGYNFLEQFNSADSLQDVGQSLGDDDDRRLVNLLTDQVEFCDVCILNKTDMLAEADLKKLKGTIRALNADAEIIEATYSSVPLDKVINTGRFDFDKAGQMPLWLKEARGEHVPETENYSINSFTFESKRPFHAEKFCHWCTTKWPNLVRAKGFFWLATRWQCVGELSLAGQLLSANRAGTWFGEYPKGQWPEEIQEKANSESWKEPFYDRAQKLVLIGVDMDEEHIRQSLESCLLNDEEMSLGLDHWLQMPDPFPVWPTEDVE